MLSTPPLKSRYGTPCTTPPTTPRTRATSTSRLSESPSGEPPRRPVCVPLLKFHANEEHPHLVDEGLLTLASLPPPVSIVALLGDGRCGKSTLGSKLDENRSIFPVGNTGVPVTEGIDLCVLPRRRDSTVEGSVVVLDCEGGNNPTGAIRSAVDLVAMLASTLIVQVVWGQMSEGQLQQIGQGLALRDRLLISQPSRCPSLTTQSLLLVVNGCHLKYTPEQLSASILEIHHGSQEARSELRARIKRSYEKINCLTLPLESDASYAEKLSVFRRSVSANCPPVAMAGSILSGAQVAELIKTAVRELQRAGVVPVASVFRHVIYDHLLAPLVGKYFQEYETFLPDLSSGEYRPDLFDRRTEILQRFDRESEHLTYTELVREAHADLVQRLDRAWENVYQQNQANGEQTCDLSMEYETRFERSEDRVVSWKKNCLVFGSRKPVVQTCNIFREWSRTRILKKNGQISYTTWSPSPTSLEGAGASANQLSAPCCSGIISSTNGLSWAGGSSVNSGVPKFGTPPSTRSDRRSSI